MIDALIMILLFLTSVFLILLVLVQRGRGGGLAGAFGGLGGQSAFGTKAGDLFTRITIGVAAFWILLCAASVKYFSAQSRGVLDVGNAAAPVSPAAGGAAKETDGKSGAAGGSAAAKSSDGAGSAAPAKSEAAPAGGATSTSQSTPEKGK